MENPHQIINIDCFWFIKSSTWLFFDFYFYQDTQHFIFFLTFNLYPNRILIGHHKVHTSELLVWWYIWTTDLYLDNYNYHLNLFWLIFSFLLDVFVKKCGKGGHALMLLITDCVWWVFSYWKVEANPLVPHQPTFPDVYFF